MKNYKNNIFKNNIEIQDINIIESEPSIKKWMNVDNVNSMKQFFNRGNEYYKMKYYKEALQQFVKASHYDFSNTNIKNNIKICTEKYINQKIEEKKAQKLKNNIDEILPNWFDSRIQSDFSIIILTNNIKYSNYFPTTRIDDKKDLEKALNKISWIVDIEFDKKIYTIMDLLKGIK